MASRSLRIGALLLFIVGCSTLSAVAQSSQTQQRVPVLIELFTSEGCSDCPPADALLARLDSTQFIPDADAIVLSEHVTYWNHDGWRDPFSLDDVDERQRSYVFRFGLKDSYTPQAVIDGSVQMVGNNANAVASAIEQAAKNPKQQIAIENARWENGGAQFSIRSSDNSGDHLVVALAADSARRNVSAGENAGHTLSHVAVMRAMKDFGAKATDGHPLHLGGNDLNDKSGVQGPVRLVAFLVDHKTGRVVAVAEQKLER
ncbi:MAG TPA: DUF1223 domain-containing protein [Terracidiphilus sp.]|nr:DUF1223 domain-containing protein [Terracidiphilus sp.]